MKNTYILFIGFIIFVIIFFISKKNTQNFDEETAISVFQKWNTYSKKYSAYFKIPSNLILSIICVESQGNENAIGKTDDYGLMQITPIALKEFNEYFKKGYTISELMVSYYNIEVGAGYLAILKNRFKRNSSDYYKFYNSNDTQYQNKVNKYLEFYNNRNLY